MSEIREAVKAGTETSVRLLNYKKNGQPFWNLFTLAPMADVDGNLRFIIGVQVCIEAVMRLMSAAIRPCNHAVLGCPFVPMSGLHCCSTSLG